MSETYNKIPDWTQLYSAASTISDDDNSWPITPRTAMVLHATLEILGDQAKNDADELGDEPVTAVNGGGCFETFARLPQVTQYQDKTWRKRFAQAFFDLADNLACGEWLSPDCTAEEMALHLALQDAPSQLEIIMEDDSSDWGLELSSLPACEDGTCPDTCPDKNDSCEEHSSRSDYDWDMLSEMLFEDHDVLMLFNPALDGIEKDEGIAKRMGFANLGVSDWFKPFR